MTFLIPRYWIKAPHTSQANKRPPECGLLFYLIGSLRIAILAPGVEADRLPDTNPIFQYQGTVYIKISRRMVVFLSQIYQNFT
jgi:hypothetical protein